MVKSGLAAVAAALAVCVAAPASAGISVPMLNEALRNAAAGECDLALDPLLRNFDDAHFWQLTRNSRRIIIVNIVNCALSLERWPAALRAAKALTEYDENDPELYALIFRLGDRVDDKAADSYDAAVKLATIAPQRLGTQPLERVRSIFRKLRETPKGDLRRPFLETMFKAGYAPPDPLDTLDFLRRDYILLAARAGDQTIAAAQAALITDVQAMIELLSDASVDPVIARSAAPTQAALPGALAALIAGAERRAAAYPMRLRAQSDLIEALRMAGRTDEAVRIGAQFAAAVRTHGAPLRYADYADQARWVIEGYANALYDAGRNDAGRAEYRAAAGLLESGRPNVIQAINAAFALLAEGRAGEASAAVAMIDRDATSAVGSMFIAAIRACSRSIDAPLRADDPDLAYLARNEGDNDSARALGLLCANDLAGYAALHAQRLADPERRTRALRAAQNMKIPPRRAMPFEATIRARRDAALARTDAEAATAAYGRRLDLPVYATYWATL